MQKNWPVPILLLFTWLQVAGQVAGITQPDQGLFEAIGYHLVHGKILYAEAFDHKPPGIFLINAFYYFIGGHGENIVCYGTLFFALLQCIIFYKLTFVLFKNKIPSFFSTTLFIFIFFGKEVFGTGNFSEQYGALCTTTALLFLIYFVEEKALKYLLLASFFFGLAPWFKEPFLFSSIPFFIYTFYLIFKRKINFKSIFKVVFSYFLPSIVFILWIILFASWDGFLENIRYSSGYASARDTSIWSHLWLNRNGFYYSLFASVTISFLISLPGNISLFTKKWGYAVSLFIGGQQICDWIATGMSGNWYAHYFLQTTPLSILIVCMGIYWTNGLLKKWIHLNVQIIIFPVLTLFCLFQWQTWKTWKLNPEKTYFDAIGRYLDKNEPKIPRNIVLASHDLGFYLPVAQGISQMRYVVPYPYHWTQLKGEIKNQRCTEDSILLVKNPPPYMIYNGECATFFQDGHMDSFVIKNYHEVVRTYLKEGRNAILLKINAH